MVLSQICNGDSAVEPPDEREQGTVRKESASSDCKLTLVFTVESLTINSALFEGVDNNLLGSEVSLRIG
jgi:hypothetical protein